MASLINTETSQLITRFVSLEESQELIRASQTFLDGSVYIQRIGNPTKYFTVTAFVDRTGKSLLENAEDTTALLLVSVKHGEYQGRITQLNFSQRMACDFFKATITLAKEVDE